MSAGRRPCINRRFDEPFSENLDHGFHRPWPQGKAADAVVPGGDRIGRRERRSLTFAAQRVMTIRSLLQAPSPTRRMK